MLKGGNRTAVFHIKSGNEIILLKKKKRERERKHWACLTALPCSLQVPHPEKFPNSPYRAMNIFAIIKLCGSLTHRCPKIQPIRELICLKSLWGQSSLTLTHRCPAVSFSNKTKTLFVFYAFFLLDTLCLWGAQQSATTKAPAHSREITGYMLQAGLLSANIVSGVQTVNELNKLQYTHTFGKVQYTVGHVYSRE